MYSAPCALDEQSTWTGVQHDGPNHLELRSNAQVMAIARANVPIVKMVDWQVGGNADSSILALKNTAFRGLQRQRGGIHLFSVSKTSPLHRNERRTSFLTLKQTHHLSWTVLT